MTWHLFHTNDFHNRLGASGARTLREALEAVGEAPRLVLDAGDAVKAGNLGVSPGGEPILKAMGELGVDAMTLGNRETHPSRALFHAKIADAPFPLLCANVRPQRGGPLHVVPHVVFARAGLRVAVLGLTIPMVTERSAARLAWDMVFDDPVRTAAAAVPALRADADLVIALTHIGVAQDRRLAESVPGIDLIVSGHSHVVYEAPQVVAGVPIVQAGSHARFYGHATFDGTRLTDYALHPLEAAA